MYYVGVHHGWGKNWHILARVSPDHISASGTRTRGQVGVMDSSFDSIDSFDFIDSFDSIHSIHSFDSFDSLDLLACYSYYFQKLSGSTNVLKPESWILSQVRDHGAPRPLLPQGGTPPRSADRSARPCTHTCT